MYLSSLPRLCSTLLLQDVTGVRVVNSYLLTYRASAKLSRTLSLTVSKRQLMLIP
jgi:hypothetical protein